MCHWLFEENCYVEGQTLDVIETTEYVAAQILNTNAESSAEEGNKLFLWGQELTLMQTDGYKFKEKRKQAGLDVN